MSSVLQGLLEELQNAIKTFLDDEIERTEKDRDFLLAVLDGRTGGSDYNVEDASTDNTADLLTTLLQEHLTVEED